MSLCQARFGEFACDRPHDHTGIHIGTLSESWWDGDEPEPDPRDADLAAMRAALERMVRAMPRCGWKFGPCDRRATRELSGLFYACDEHARGSGVDLPHAPALRAALAALAGKP